MFNLKAIVLGIVLALASVSSAFAQCGTTAPANKFCGNDAGSQALATWKSVPAGALSAIGGGTVLGNRTGASAVPTAVTNPVLGIPGTSTGEVGLAGLTSGTAVLRAQAAAGSAVSLLPTSAGTLVSTASSPLAVNATTGLMTCPTCVTSSGGGAITGTAPITVSAAGAVSINAPYVTLTASNGGIVYSGATNLAILAGTATARQMLQSGASTTPAWSTATWPATTTINRILYSSAANVVGEITTANGGLLNTSSVGAPSITATPVLGVAGTTVGSLGFQNLTSGTVTLQPVTGALGAVTISIPAAAGTMAVSATAPVTLSAAGAIGCATCLTANQTITLSGDVTGSGTTAIATTLATVNANVGTFGSATQASQVTVNAKGLITAAANVTVTPAVGSITGLGTGVATALGVNVGTAGSFVTNGGALGTPSSGTATNLTGLPISTGVSGLGSGVATAASVGVNGSGGFVTFSGVLGTPASGTLTNAVGLPIATGVSGLGAGVATALGVAANGAGGFPTYTAGSWTPGYVGSGTAGTGQTYAVQVGSYEVIGRHVTARFNLTATSLGTAAGNLLISMVGLPSITATTSDSGVCYVSLYAVTGLAANNFSVTGIISPGASNITLLSNNNTSTLNVTIAQAGASVTMNGACEYHT